MPKLGERMPFELTWKQELGLESVAKPDKAKGTAPSKERRETEVRTSENEKKSSSRESKK
jgi:hypothetical protein